MKLINTESQRAAIAPFETIEQLNANTTAIRDQWSEFLITSEKAVLDVLHRYATKHFGVCYLSKSTIAEMVGLSRRQVIRICKRFEALGIIAQYETDRKRGGGQTSNTIVFLTQISAREAFVAESAIEADNKGVDTGDVTPDVTGLDALKDAPEELKTNRLTDDTDARDALENGLLTKLPKAVTKALAPFFNHEDLYAHAGVIFKAKSAIDRTVAIEDYETEYYDAITSVVNAYKRGKVRNFAAVLYSAIKTTTNIIVRKNAWGLAF